MGARAVRTKVIPLAAGASYYILKYRLIPFCYYVLRLYLYLLRVRIVGEGLAMELFETKGRIIAALWHQRLLPALAYVHRFRGLKPVVMISQSRDGEMIARIAQRLGLVPVRGSSSRGGRRAFMAMLRALKRSPAVVHIVDGPRGPKAQVKPGVIRMAQVTGAPILPIIVSAERAWVMKSWDRFLVPKPFSKVTISWGEPFIVPRKMDRGTYEKVRKELEERLIQAYAQADLNAGWAQPL